MLHRLVTTQSRCAIPWQKVLSKLGRYQSGHGSQARKFGADKNIARFDSLRIGTYTSDDDLTRLESFAELRQLVGEERDRIHRIAQTLPSRGRSPRLAIHTDKHPFKAQIDGRLCHLRAEQYLRIH